MVLRVLNGSVSINLTFLKLLQRQKLIGSSPKEKFLFTPHAQKSISEGVNP